MKFYFLLTFLSTIVFSHLACAAPCPGIKKPLNEKTAVECANYKFKNEELFDFADNKKHTGLILFGKCSGNENTKKQKYNKNSYFSKGIPLLVLSHLLEEVVKGYKRVVFT